ncbi:farnesyl diphosphate synthase [Lactarius hatsudake]|nr:farnesyl diphosphate synthase [Lactarius hatsudake]
MLELLNYSTYSNHHTPSHPLDTANIATSPVPSCTPFPQSGNEEASGRKHFEAVYTIFLGDLLDNFRKHNMPEKLNRGLSVVDSVAILKGRELTDEEYFKVAVLGCRRAVDDWFEMQAYILVIDDIMGVGSRAINNALVVEGAIFQMIRKHFRTEPFYVDMLDLLYSTIVIHKTALYSFNLPVALALFLRGFTVEKWNESDPDYYKIALDTLVPLGDPEAEARVKEVFREVGIDAVYAYYEAQSYVRINAHISAVPEVESPNGDAVLRRTVFRVFLEKIYKRTK